MAVFERPENVTMPLQIMLTIESILDSVATALRFSQQHVRFLLGGDCCAGYRANIGVCGKA